MPVDFAAASIDNYIDEFVKNVDPVFLDPEFDMLKYLVSNLSAKKRGIARVDPEEHIHQQIQIVTDCLTPVVNAYYRDYNHSLASLTSICEDFRRNQKEVEEVAHLVEHVRGTISEEKEGMKDVYYKKLLAEYTLKNLYSIQRIRQAPDLLSHLLKNNQFISATTLYTEIFYLLEQNSISSIASVKEIKDQWEQKKIEIDGLLIDRLMKIVYDDKSMNWLTKDPTITPFEELTEFKERELVQNGLFTCNKFTTLNIIIKALCIMGSGMVAQSRLVSGFAKSVNEVVMININNSIEQIKAGKITKGESAVEATLKSILIQCEEILRTHTCCIQAFLSSVTSNSLDYESNIHAQYNTNYVFACIQSEIQAFIEKYVGNVSSIGSSSTSSHTVLASPTRGKGIPSVSSITFSFSASPAWISSQQEIINSLTDKKYNVSLFSQLSDPDPLFIPTVTYYVKAFMNNCNSIVKNSTTKLHDQIAQYSKAHKIGRQAALENEVDLISFLNRRIENDLSNVLNEKAVSIVQQAVSKPESYILDMNLLVLNCSLEIINGFEYLNEQITLLGDSYGAVTSSVYKLFQQNAAKFMGLIESLSRTSFAKKRNEWGGQGAMNIMFNNINYMKIIEEIPGMLMRTYPELSEKRIFEEDTAINGDIYSFAIDPASDRDALLSSSQLSIICNICESCCSVISCILESMRARNEVKDQTKIDLTRYNECIITCSQQLMDVCDNAMLLIQDEITSRIYYHLQRLRSSFHKSSYNDVPPAIIEMHKDMRSLCDILHASVSPAKLLLFGDHLKRIITTFLTRIIVHIPIDCFDEPVFVTLKKCSVCCCQTVHFLLPVNEAMSATRKLTDYFNLAIMSKEQLQTFIINHPFTYTNIDYMNLFKINTVNRERDDAAIDWIEDIITKNEKSRVPTKTKKKDR